MTCRKQRICNNRLLCGLIFLLAQLSGHVQAETPLDKQRAVYSEAMEEIRQGKVENAEAAIPQLHDYILFPYLELELLKAQIDSLSSRTIDVYLNEYRNTVVGARIERAWLLKLKRHKEWAEFLHYAGDKPPRNMRCEYITALQATDQGALAEQETEKLWLTGYSLPDSCDALLNSWLHRQSPEQLADLHWRRAALAIEQGQHKLAKYLLKKVPDTEPLQQLLSKPETLYKAGFALEVNDFNRQLVMLTLKRLAADDFESSNTLWHQLDRRFQFTAKENYALRDSFARQYIAGSADDARDWINANDPNFEDPYLTEWRVRLALRDQDWAAAQQFIKALPEDYQDKPDWQYWWARADMEKNQALTDEAQAILRQMATERGYYSFLAADMLNQEYRLGEKRNLKPELIAEVEQRTAIQRAKELHWHRDFSAAKSEWRSAIYSLSKEEQIAAAQLALNWGWSHTAVATAIRAGEWDDLVLRFPLAFYSTFDENAKSQNIDLKWVYAIARQESAFAEDARSRVGARGVMQLMPGTAKTISRQMNRSAPSNDDLETAELNIEMGTFYLAQLLEEFGGNRILATAAYNAGPNRVKRVLSRQQEQMPADIWVENLPYGETRNYIKNVMAFSVVYGIKLKLAKPILASHERHITPLQEINTP